VSKEKMGICGRHRHKQMLEGLGVPLVRAEVSQKMFAFTPQKWWVEAIGMF